VCFIIFIVSSIRNVQILYEIADETLLWLNWLVLLATVIIIVLIYTLSEAWSGVNWADIMAAQGDCWTDFYDRSILRPKHRAYYRSGRPVIKIGPKGALDSHEIRPIHSATSLGQSIVPAYFYWLRKKFTM